MNSEPYAGGWIFKIKASDESELESLGTNEKASYYSSFSYNDTQGIIDDSGQKRFTLVAFQAAYVPRSFI